MLCYGPSKPRPERVLHSDTTCVLSARQYAAVASGSCSMGSRSDVTKKEERDPSSQYALVRSRNISLLIDPQLRAEDEFPRQE